MQKQVLPISLQVTPFNSKLLKAARNPEGIGATVQTERQSAR